MKNKIELILLLIIPIILFVLIGIAIMPEDITFDNVQKEKGEITDFYEGVNTRRIHKPMYIIINNDKYFIPSAIMRYMGNCPVFLIFFPLMGSVVKVFCMRTSPQYFSFFRRFLIVAIDQAAPPFGAGILSVSNPTLIISKLAPARNSSLILRITTA